MKDLGLATVACSIVLFAVPMKADTNKVRSIHLSEAIEMALEHNLSVQIERYNPLLDKYALEADYGPYDPSFVGIARDNSTALPGQLQNNGLRSPQVDINDQSYAFGFAGQNGSNALTPWGLQYNLTSTLDRTTYASSALTSNGFPVAPFTQNRSFAGITLDQPLLRNFWIDSTRATIMVAKKTVQFDEWGFRQLVMTNISLTEQAYDELNYAFESVKVQEEAVTLAEQLVDENRKRVKAGVMTTLDVAQSQSQLATARAGLLAARQAVTADENNLKNLITDKYRNLYDVQLVPAEKLLAVPEMFDLQESWQTAMNMRPDLRQARINIERLQINRRFQQNQLFPQLDATGSYGRTGLSADLNNSYDQIPANQFPSYSYGMVLSVPLSNLAARNNYKAAKAFLKQAELQYQQVEQTMLVQVQNTIESAKSDYEQINATREARQFAEQALMAEQKKLEVGTSTPFVVLQLQSNLTAARSAEIRALADYNEALALLAQYEGTTLEKHHLTVKLY